MKYPDFKHKKSLGQHFLTTDIVPKWLCEAAAVDADETIVEIGPGTGALTRALLAASGRVIGLEADIRALEILQESFTQELTTGQLTLHHYDVRQLNPATFDFGTDHYKVVANIPYYLSGHLFRVFLETDKQPDRIVFLVQREVAKRATTSLDRTEKESLLSLSIKAYGTPTYIRTVGRGHFAPPPRVDSAIIAITDISKQNFANLDEQLFFQILHLGFGQKRKQLLGNLSVRWSREILTAVFSKLGLPLHVRAEDLPLNTWLSLGHELSSTVYTPAINS